MRIDYRAILDYITMRSGFVLGGKHFVKKRRKKQIVYARLPEHSASIEHMRQMVEESVRNCLHESLQVVPPKVGCTISGGIDSSTIACIVAKIMDKPTDVFSGTYDEPECDETAYSKRVVEENSLLRHHIVKPDGKDFLSVLEKMYKSHMLDFPEGGPGIYSQYKVCEVAAEKGVKILFTGEGGDEIFCGYPFFVNAPVEHKLLNPMYRGIFFSYRLAAKQFVLEKQRSQTLWKELIRMPIRFLKDRMTDLSNRFFRFIARDDKLINSLLSGNFRSQLDGYSVREEFLRIFDMYPSPYFFDKAQHFYLTQCLPALCMGDQSTARIHGLISKSPFIHEPLIEYVLSVSPKERIKGLKLKYLEREIAKPYIPKIVYERVDKKGFPTPYERWMLRDIGKVTDVIESLANRERLFNRSSLLNLLEEFGHGDVSYAYPIFQLLNIEFWFRNYVDTEKKK